MGCEQRACKNKISRRDAENAKFFLESENCLAKGKSLKVN